MQPSVKILLHNPSIFVKFTKHEILNPYSYMNLLIKFLILFVKFKFHGQYITKKHTLYTVLLSALLEFFYLTLQQVKNKSIDTHHYVCTNQINTITLTNVHLENLVCISLFQFSFHFVLRAEPNMIALIELLLSTELHFLDSFALHVIKFQLHRNVLFSLTVVVSNYVGNAQ